LDATPEQGFRQLHERFGTRHLILTIGSNGALWLNTADTIRSKRQQAIDLADEFLQSVFMDMFGDTISPKSENSISITECFDITTGKLNSNVAFIPF